MNICILIPVYNEAKEIGNIVEAIKNKKLDVLVIDDGSTDNSGSIAQEKGAIVVQNEQKQGKGASLQKGFLYARNHNYNGIITMDGDGQHDVKDIDVFLKKIVLHPNSIVTGNRMDNSKDMPLLRQITNRVMSSLISNICRQSIPDSQCGYRYIGSDILNQLELIASDFEIETEVLIKASKLGYKIYSIPIRTIYRDEKSKINPLKDTIRFFIYLFNEWRHENKRDS